MKHWPETHLIDYWTYAKFPLCCLDLKEEINLDLNGIHLVGSML